MQMGHTTALLWLLVPLAFDGAVPLQFSMVAHNEGVNRLDIKMTGGTLREQHSLVGNLIRYRRKELGKQHRERKKQGPERHPTVVPPSTLDSSKDASEPMKEACYALREPCTDCK